MAEEINKTTYVTFEKWVDESSASIRASVFHFPQETKQKALERWLVSTKYDLDKLKEKVLEATKVRELPSVHSFWPDESVALQGFSPQLFKKLLPHGFYAQTKRSGSPILFFKLGTVELHSVEACVSSTQILQLHWHLFTHKFNCECERLGCKTPEFFAVVDVKGMGLDSLDENFIKLLQELMRIVSVCFPETLQNILVLSPPTFLEIAWDAIMAWIDKSTSAKVEVFVNRDKGLERLHSVVLDTKQLPSEYGGLQRELEADEEGAGRRFELQYMRVSTSPTILYITLAEDESLSASIYSKCQAQSIFKGLLLRTPQHEGDVMLRPYADKMSAFLMCGDDNTPYFAPRVVLGPLIILPLPNPPGMPQQQPPPQEQQSHCELGGGADQSLDVVVSSEAATDQAVKVLSTPCSASRDGGRSLLRCCLDEDTRCSRFESAVGEAPGGLVLGPGIVTIEGKLCEEAGRGGEVGDDNEGGRGDEENEGFFKSCVGTGDWSERKPYAHGNFVVVSEILKLVVADKLEVVLGKLGVQPDQSEAETCTLPGSGKEYAQITLSDMINHPLDPPCDVVRHSPQDGVGSSASSGATAVGEKKGPKQQNLVKLDLVLKRNNSV